MKYNKNTMKQKLTAAYSIQVADFVKNKGWIPMPLNGKIPLYKNWQNFDQQEGYNKCIKGAKNKYILVLML